MGALKHHVLSAGKTMKQLQELREFLRVGDGDSAKRLIENLNPSSVVSAGNVDLAKLPKDVLRTSLIPDIDIKPGHSIAVQETGNGNCLYNSTSLSLCGDELQCTALRLLVASELYFNAGITQLMKCLKGQLNSRRFQNVCCFRLL